VKSYILAYLLALSAASMLFGNAYANTGSKSFVVDTSNSCRATYTFDEGTFYVPYVEVPTVADESQFYVASMRQISDTEPLQFSIAKVMDISMVLTNNINQGVLYVIS